jgi:hypothetical protein
VIVLACLASTLDPQAGAYWGLPIGLIACEFTIGRRGKEWWRVRKPKWLRCKDLREARCETSAHWPTAAARRTS